MTTEPDWTDLSWFGCLIGDAHVDIIRVRPERRLTLGASIGGVELLQDYKDGDTLNNRRGNLRACTRSQSNANRRRRSDSRAPYRGITQTPIGRWLAQIMAEKKFTRIGLFDTPEAAAAAYDKKALELHGEFARINNIAC